MTKQADLKRKDELIAKFKAQGKASQERQNRIKGFRQDIDTLKAQRTQARAEVVRLEKLKTNTQNEIETLDPNDPGEAAQIEVLAARIESYNTDITKTKNGITAIDLKLVRTQSALNTQITGGPGAGGAANPSASSSSSSSAPSTADGSSRTEQTKNGGGANDWKKGGYTYNAPLVKAAYFTSINGISESLQGKMANEVYIDQGNWDDARKAWQNNIGGRGTIQMSREHLAVISEAQTRISDLKYDPKLYGFKFLYNPEKVGMAWGIMDQMDPTYVASGDDPFAAISAGLMSSSVTFNLILNRIEDFKYFTIGGGFLHDPNPYPITIPTADRLEIFEKGTMYDIEYLFKTLNGPNAVFTSNLNGITADRGWLRPSIVELHLGARMRYKVRVQNLAINHAIFNARMVPIFSTVQLTVGRFNDGPALTDAQKVNSRYYGGTGAGGRYIGSTFYSAAQLAAMGYK
jgi:hypothetical protein